MHANSPSSHGPRPGDDTVTVAALRSVRQEGRIRVLLADDTQLVRMFVTRLLEFAGHEVQTVETGREAVAAVRAGQFDLVLMDLQMPDLDGRAATVALRSGGCVVPIVALTATATNEERLACRDAGMNGFLAKPFTLAAFDAEWQRVRQVLSRGELSLMQASLFHLDPALGGALQATVVGAAPRD